MSLPSSLLLEAGNSSGSIATYSATAHSSSGSVVPVVCGPASGTIFPIGSTIVSCSASDSKGIASRGQFTVTVRVTIPPHITPPQDVTALKTGQLTAVSIGSPVVTDPVDPNPMISNNAPPTGFPAGTSVVVWTAADHYGNSATAQQRVTIVAMAPDVPTITVPANITLSATNSSGAVVEYGGVSAQDPKDGNLVPVCLPSSGTIFPIGLTAVECSATNSLGNVSHSSFSVRVIVTTPPTIVAPRDLVENSTGSLTNVSLGSPVVTDQFDRSPTVSNNAPSMGFPVGKSVVTWKATDHYGNSATAIQQVTIIGATQPNTNGTSSGSTFNVVNFGAVPDGRTDDTAPIRAAISAAAAAGGGTVYFPAGTYMVDCILNGTNSGSNITLKGDSNAILELRPQSAKPLAGQSGFILLEGPNKPFTNLTIDGLIFDGNKAVQSQKPMDSGLREKKYYALMRVWKNPALGVAVDHITIQNSIFQNGIAAGMEFEGVDYVTLNNVQLLNNGYIKTLSDGKLQGQADGIYITGSNEVLNDVTARDNADTDITFEGMETWGTAQITNCVISGNSEAGLALANNPTQAAYQRTAVHDVTVNNCNIQMTNRDLSLYERGTRSLLLEDYGSTGILPKNIEIKNSYIGSNDWAGILVKGHNINIHDNTMEKSSVADMILAAGANQTIQSNHLSSSTIGIQIVARGSNFVVDGNTLANTTTGVDWSGAHVTNLSMFNNTFSGTQRGYYPAHH